MPGLTDPRWPGAGHEPAEPPDPHPASPPSERETRPVHEADLAGSQALGADLGSIEKLRETARATIEQTAVAPEVPGDVLHLGGGHLTDDEDSLSVIDAAILANQGPVARPVNWVRLPAPEAEQCWLELNGWVHWLRGDFGLPAAIIPPCWHLHPELVWELSALYSAWAQAYDPQQNAAGPIGWLAQFAASRDRLRAWVQTAGCKIDRHRNTRTATWPGETDHNDPTEYRIHNREEEFVSFVEYDISEREKAENGTDLDPGLFSEESAADGQH